MVSVSVLELNIKLLWVLPVFRKFDALNMQLQCPRQLPACGPPPGNVGNCGTYFEDTMESNDRWAFLRNPTPAFFQEFPDQIINHAVSSHGCFTRPYK